MPYQGPWSECNHCNNNMLAAHKLNASALFWYTQRYHSLRTLEHGPTAEGLLYQIHSVEPQDRGPWTPDHGPRVSDHGPSVLAL